VSDIRVRGGRSDSSLTSLCGCELLSFFFVAEANSKLRPGGGGHFRVSKKSLSVFVTNFEQILNKFSFKS